MDNTGNRRLLFAVGMVLFLAIIVIVWYFFYAKPAIAPTLGTPTSATGQKTFPPRFQFLNWINKDSGTTTTEVTDPLALPLVQIWKKPATEGIFTTQQILVGVDATTTLGTSTTVVTIKKTVRATSTVITFVDKITGYVYGYPVETGKVFQISNTIIPGVYDAYFFNNGSRVIMRYIDHNKNAVVGLIATVPTVGEQGTPLPLENIQYLTGAVVSVAVNQRKDQASYVVATGNGTAIYTLSNKDPALVATSPFREWNLGYGGDSLFLTSKPSAYVEGITVSLPSFQIEITGKTGLMSNPSASQNFINSMWASKGLVTFFSKGGKIQLANVATLASKCTWGEKDFLVCAVPRTLPSPVEGLPDDWFQGRVSFNDDLFLLDKNTGERYPLYSFSETEGVFDITNIMLSTDNKLFTFIQKQDESLWLLNTNLIRAD